MTTAKDVLAKYKNVNEKKNNEEFDAEKAISDLIDTDFSASDDEKGKAANLIKGLFFSDDPKAVALIKKMDAWFSSMK